MEVRDGRVLNYRGDYEAYLYSINKEIDDAEQAQRPAKAPTNARKSSKASEHVTKRSDREMRKEMAGLEKTISGLEEQKADVNQQLMAATDPAEALRLHTELTSLTTQLSKAEERWFELQELLSAER